MILYFCRKYTVMWGVIISGFILFAMLFGGIPPAEIAPMAVFWGGLVAAWQLYREFKRKNIWPLFDNLRISKGALFGIALAVNVFVSIGLRLWLR